MSVTSVSSGARSKGLAAITVGTLLLLVSVLSLMVRTASSVEIPPPYDVAINPGNVPATATGEGCNEFGDKSDDDLGWLFVASPANFTSFLGIWEDASHVPHQVVVSSQADVSATQYFPKQYDHLAIVTPDGWTLVAAFATLDDPDKDQFQLSHTCGTADTEESPSPSPSASESESPSPSPSASESESPSPSPSQTVSESPSASPSETVSESPSASPSETVSESPSVLPSETASEQPSESESPEVLPSETESERPSPQVSGVKQTKPKVIGGSLSRTGSPLPVGLLVLLGVGMLALGVAMTVASPKAAPAGRHRKS